MGEITQNITGVTAVSRKNFTDDAADAMMASLELWGGGSGELSVFAIQANGLRTEVNGSKDDAETAKTLAEQAAQNATNQAVIASSAANFKGNWSDLTGPLNMPAGVYHLSKFWQLASDLIDVTAKVPGTDPEWIEIVTLPVAIETPSVTYPTDTGTGLPLSFSATGTTYRSLYDYSQADAQIQLSKLSDFSSLEVNDSLGEAGTSFSITGLDGTTLYYCKIRYQDSADVWSEWSDIISFTTANVYIDTPTNVSPADTEASIGETPELSSNAFECINGSDTHLNSDWEVYSDAGLTTLVWSSYDDTSNLESITIPAGNLSEGETSYYWRCRHTGTTYGDSAWSTETSFTTVASFANIVGIALVSAGGGAGTWQQIDADGNNVAPDAAFFSNHAMYGNISDVTIDGQAMVKIPKFYIKQDIAGGDQAGKKAWWISDVPASGFSLDPAFMDAGVEIDQFYYAKYEATDDGGTKAGSVVGVSPLVSIDFPTMQSRCTARNTGGVDGFRMVDIHELSAVQLLCLIENGGPDVQSTIGTGNTASSAAVNTGSSNAVWRGIYELWGNVRCMIDGVQFDTNNQIKVFDQNGNGTYISTGVTASATDGWITGMHDDSGTGFDLGMLFLGKTFDGTEGNGTFGDYEYSPDLTEDNVFYHGGDWSLGSQAGLFDLFLYGGAADAAPRFGSRLAKV
ncbi:MAG: hypothetical protein J7L96_02275 [Bacteroidales bacterium]|nr:hypothetical protein [Bacteroidales bacterium]